MRPKDIWPWRTWMFIRFCSCCALKWRNPAKECCGKILLVLLKNSPRCGSVITRPHTYTPFSKGAERSGAFSEHLHSLVFGINYPPRVTFSKRTKEFFAVSCWFTQVTPEFELLHVTAPKQITSDRFFRTRAEDSSQESQEITRQSVPWIDVHIDDILHDWLTLDMTLSITKHLFQANSCLLLKLRSYGQVSISVSAQQSKRDVRPRRSGRIRKDGVQVFALSPRRCWVRFSYLMSYRCVQCTCYWFTSNYY